MNQWPQPETITPEQFEDAVEKWHTVVPVGPSIFEYLGWTWDQYKSYLGPQIRK